MQVTKELGTCTNSVYQALFPAQDPENKANGTVLPLSVGRD